MAQKKEDKNLIHVRFDFEEAIEARRDVLYSQIVSLRMEKALKAYSSHRIKEFDLKERFYKKLKGLKASINKLEKVLPKLEIPAIVERKKKGSHDSFESQDKGTQKNEDIEGQLREIQNRLDSLQREGTRI